MNLLARLRHWSRQPRAYKLLSIRYRLDSLRDGLRERAAGLDLAGRAAVADPGARLYMASHSHDMRRAIGEALRHGPFDRFVDIGAGKGKTCLFAAGLGVFREVVGVELSPDLVRVAEANAANAGRSIRFLCADARTYELPAGRTLVYLFNPFDAATLRAFLARNAAHFREGGSVVAYVDNREAAEIAAAGFEVLRRWDVPPVSIHRIRT
jgi:SAM-dependent methyltransferase